MTPRGRRRISLLERNRSFVVRAPHLGSAKAVLITDQGCRTRASRGLRAHLLITSVSLICHPRPARAGVQPARSGQPGVTRLRGAGREEGSKVAGGWGFLPKILAPPLPPERLPPNRCRCQELHPGPGAKGGQTPGSKPPAVDPEVDPDDGCLTANNCRLLLFPGAETRGTHPVSA